MDIHICFLPDSEVVIPGTTVTVSLGTNDLRDMSGAQKITGKFTAHNGFDFASFSNDIALIHLDSEAKINGRVKTIPLAASGSVPAAGTDLLASGFGTTAGDLLG